MSIIRSSLRVLRAAAFIAVMLFFLACALSIFFLPH
jgi:hypothetical protein